ncbi:unnamed protein product [Cylindrotheca closterium]|uniref:Uncharacterized protein n=1 Tax=Cylindrotheca closterium TaxID=2856 RepID=A0AAD2FER5_9STRA|nr:unnamed protein product [Cylindrotheca closterium]
MLEVDFYNDKGRFLRSMYGEIELPDGASKIKIHGSGDNVNNGFQMLLNMLKRYGGKINMVSLHDIQEISPEMLAFLVWIASKTNGLEVYDCKLGDSGFASLMSAVLQPNGLTKLELTIDNESPRITKHQATLLFEGVALSSSLKNLRIDAYFEDHDLNEIGPILLYTLRRNRSLKDLQLITNCLGREGLIGSLIQAAVLQTKVTDLHLEHADDTEETISSISLDTLADSVCRRDCSLRDLLLDNILLEPESSAKSAAMEKNSSVICLNLLNVGIALPDAMPTIRLFDSLKDLVLMNCSISDLTPLDEILLRGKESKLERLTLNGNDITEQDLIIFLEKVPRMRCLKCLELADMTCLEVTETCVAALKNAVWSSTSLESVYYNFESASLKQLDSMIKVATTLNRGGQRKHLDCYPISLPQNLWSHVLKRAMTIKYYDDEDEWKLPTLTTPCFDAVYWLLSTKMHF